MKLNYMPKKGPNVMPAAKKSRTKTAATKRPAAKKPSVSKVKPAARASKSTAPMKSFKRTNNDLPFFTFRATSQTLYWLVLSGVVLVLGLWVNSINMRVQSIYDQIDASNQINDGLTDKEMQRY